MQLGLTILKLRGPLIYQANVITKPSQSLAISEALKWRPRLWNLWPEAYALPVPLNGKIFTSVEGWTHSTIWKKKIKPFHKCSALLVFTTRPQTTRFKYHLPTSFILTFLCGGCKINYISADNVLASHSGGISRLMQSMRLAVSSFTQHLLVITSITLTQSWM